MDATSSNPLLVVISGPSGVGKDAVLTRMKDEGLAAHFTVTVTTRPKRKYEVDGIDYIFVTRDGFQQMIDKGELLEYAEVYGNLNGVPQDQVTDAINSGRDVLVKVDVKGAASIRELVPEALFIFIAPPSLNELDYRLKQRMTESDSALQLRQASARVEMQESAKFDHIVINHTDQIDETVHDIRSIIQLERQSGRKIRLN